MKDRCNNPKNKSFKNYGGRGIKICQEWLDDFTAFRDWALSSGFQEGLTIERIDNNGDYEPSNCTWIPIGEQRRNNRNIHEVTAFGETKLLMEWTRDPRCVVCRKTLRLRLKSGWDPEKAIAKPWKGKDGITLERPGFFFSDAWKAASEAVWARDQGICRKCGKKQCDDTSTFHVHHVVSFAYFPLRYALDNLLLLCKSCHDWVHSRENIDSLFIKGIPEDPAPVTYSQSALF